MHNFLDKKFQVQVLKRLEKENTIFTDAKHRVNYGINILNGIKRELYTCSKKEELIEFIVTVVECLKHENIAQLDKYILNLLHICYSPCLIEQINNPSDVNTETALTLIKYKNDILHQEDILEFIEMHKEDIRKNNICKQLIKELKEIYVKARDEIRENNIIETEFKNYVSDIKNIDKISDIEKYIEEMIVKKTYVWNDISVYEEHAILSILLNNCTDKIKINKIMNLFFNGVHFLTHNEISKSICCFNEIAKTKYLKVILCDVIALSYFYKLKYKEAEYMVEKAFINIENYKETTKYFRNILFFLQRISGKHTTHSLTQLNFELLPLTLKKLFVYNKNTIEDITNKTSSMEFVLKHVYRKKVLLHFYIFNNEIFVINYYDMSIQKLISGAKEFMNEFDELFRQNKELFSKRSDQNIWKTERNALDKELKMFMNRIKYYISNSKNISTVYVLLEDVLNKLPVEISLHFENENIDQIFRVFDISDVKYEIPQFDPNSTFYLLDPKNNLHRTQHKITDCLKELSLVKGSTGKILNFEENQQMNKNKTFLYFGHGSGRKYYNVENNTNIREMNLFGCGSVKTQDYQNYLERGDTENNIKDIKSNSELDLKNNPLLDVNACAQHIIFKNNGHLMNICNNKIIFGCLWDVTDKDLDAFTVKFLQLRYENKKEAYDVERHKKLCKTKHLNGGAFVVYISNNSRK